MSARRIHPALVAGGVAAALALLSILVVSFVTMRRASDAESCKINLRILDLAVKGAALPRDSKWERASPGRAFFSDVHRWPRRPDRPFSPRCPVLGDRGDGIDYRGPARSISGLAATDPYVADRPGNHGPDRGGNVLLLNGEIHEVAPDHPLWRRAEETTTD